MRRLLSIALLAVLGLPFAAAFFSATTVAELQLPACCRRAGAHHCAMTERGDGGAATGAATHTAHWRTLSERCPYSPGTAVSARGTSLGSPQQAPGILLRASHPTSIEQSECRRRIARDRARGTRGPPSSLAA